MLTDRLDGMVQYDLHKKDHLLFSHLHILQHLSNPIVNKSQIKKLLSKYLLIKIKNINTLSVGHHYEATHKISS